MAFFGRAYTNMLSGLMNNQFQSPNPMQTSSGEGDFGREMPAWHPFLRAMQLQALMRNSSLSSSSNFSPSMLGGQPETTNPYGDGAATPGGVQRKNQPYGTGEGGGMLENPYIRALQQLAFSF